MREMINPVLKREMKTVIRTGKFYTVLTLYSLVLLGILFLQFNTIWNSYFSANPKNTIIYYYVISLVQCYLIMVIVPILSGSSISGERERQTLDLLVLTKMSAFSIVFGKLLASLQNVVFLVIVTMPVYAIYMYFGGVSILLFVKMTLVSLLLAVLVGGVAIFFSSIFKRTIASIIWTYILTFLLLLVYFGLSLWQLGIFEDMIFWGNYIWEILYETLSAFFEMFIYPDDFFQEYVFNMIVIVPYTIVTTGLFLFMASKNIRLKQKKVKK